MEDNIKDFKIKIPIWIINKYPELVSFKETPWNISYLLCLHNNDLNDQIKEVWYDEKIKFLYKNCWDSYKIQFKDKNDLIHIFSINIETLEYIELQIEKWLNIRIFEWDINTPVSLRDYIKFKKSLKDYEELIVKGSIDQHNLLKSELDWIVKIDWNINVSYQFLNSLPNSIKEVTWYLFQNSIFKDNTDELTTKWILKQEQIVNTNNINNEFYKDFIILNQWEIILFNEDKEPFRMDLIFCDNNDSTKWIKPNKVWLETFQKEIKKISPKYIAWLDLKNTPAASQFIHLRKNFITLNIFKAIIKLPKWAIDSIKWEAYYTITNTESSCISFKPILLMDLSKKEFNESTIWTAIEVVKDFLSDKLYNKNDYYKVVSWDILIEPFQLDPSLYI